MVFDPPNIISASRRTDIPRFFGRWFAARRAAGFAEYRTVFGHKGRVSLRDSDVLGYLFWTKYARPFAHELSDLRWAGIPYAFQYTVNDYGPDVETHMPRLRQRLDDFLTVAGDLPGPAAIQWRYDPILVSERYSARFHLEAFSRIAAALRGATCVVNISVIEPYAKTRRHLDDPNVRYRARDTARMPLDAKGPIAPPVDAFDHTPLIAELTAVASSHGIELRACANPEWHQRPACCCGPELFAPYGPEILRAIDQLPIRPSRKACRCRKSIDIGMDNTCLSGCRYCYATSSHARSVAAYRRLHPSAPSLR